MESNVKDHYNSDKLTHNIRSALVKAGKDLSTLKLKDLASIDQLHTGGARASINLFEKINLCAKTHVLDAGCGIGGSSRLMAEQFGCKVVGIDLADQFIDAALFLTRATQLESLVSFQQGSVLELPFKDNTFDTILCQHILMNIKDKTTAIKEFFRVLNPGGQLVFHEIAKGENDDMCYPVPWAAKPSISFLEPWQTTARRIKQTGFQQVHVTDESNTACSWWEKVNIFSKKKKKPANPLNPGVIFGSNAAFFGENMFANFKNNSICLVEAVLKKTK